MRTKQDTMPGGLRQERRACCGGISYGKIQPNHREEGIGRDEGNQSGGPGTGGRLPTGRMRWGERRSGAHPAEGFSQGVYDALEENWTAWEAVDELERMLSSTLPGHCAQEFDSWAQCADFLGPSIPDPAADCGWLEEAMKHFQTANRMDPNNMEYTAALNQMMWQLPDKTYGICQKYLLTAWKLQTSCRRVQCCKQLIFRQNICTSQSVEKC